MIYTVFFEPISSKDTYRTPMPPCRNAYKHSRFALLDKAKAKRFKLGRDLC